MLFFTKSVAPSALEHSYFSFYFSPPSMSNGGSPIASYNELDILNASTTTNSAVAVAPLTVPPRVGTGLPPDPHTIEIKQEMRANVLPVARSTAHPHTALLLAPLGMDTPYTGPSTRTSPLIERASPVTQHALRYLRREHRRKIEKDFFPFDKFKFCTTHGPRLYSPYKRTQKRNSSRQKAYV